MVESTAFVGSPRRLALLGRRAASRCEAPHARGFQTSRGIALVVTLLAVAMLSALGLALGLASAAERLAIANFDDGSRLLDAAEAALELAARDLSHVTDWDDVLRGAAQSPSSDGSPTEVHEPWPGVLIDLMRIANQLSCGQPLACAASDIRVATGERPWGANNPRWQPFLFGLLPQQADPLHRSAAFVAVWIGDDQAETDGNPISNDGAGAGDGRYMLRARSDAFDRRGGRRSIEAELRRVCTTAGSVETCLPGIRVQSWQMVSAVPP